MCSVDDIRERENYFVLLDDRDPEGNLSKRSVIDSYCLSLINALPILTFPSIQAVH